jgi:hypothetical protein
MATKWGKMEEDVLPAADRSRQKKVLREKAWG